jgi:pectinesterase
MKHGIPSDLTTAAALPPVFADAPHARYWVWLVSIGVAACGGSGASGGHAGSKSVDATTDVGQAADATSTSDAPVGREGSVASDASEPSDGSQASDTSDASDGTIESETEGSESGANDASQGGEAAVVKTCTVFRPQLTSAQAVADTSLSYLAQAGVTTSSTGLTMDNWDPMAGVGDVTTFVPTFTVSSTGTYQTVQSAIDAAVTKGGTARIFILVTPATYREVVCVPASAPLITLYSSNPDPTQTVIVYDNYNGEAKAAGTPANPCTPESTATTYGTAGSATFSAFAAGFEAKNLTFSNDVSVATLAATTGTQAVALMTQADKIILENVQVLGHQDTLYMETLSNIVVVRAYVKNSYISGDTDFIFGGATMVLDGCQINFVNDRKTSGSVLSPSTSSLNKYGILVTSATFTADTGTTPGAVGLGRAWDRSCVDIPTYVSTCVTTGDYPNGQALVRGSTLGPEIAADPWLAAATTKRPFCGTPWDCLSDAGGGGDVCPANRMYEYQNTGAGAATP